MVFHSSYELTRRPWHNWRRNSWAFKNEWYERTKKKKIQNSPCFPYIFLLSCSNGKSSGRTRFKIRRTSSKFMSCMQKKVIVEMLKIKILWSTFAGCRKKYSHTAFDPRGRPQSRSVVIIVFAHVRPYFSKQNKWKQCSLLARLWVWPRGSLMTPVLQVFFL